MTFIRPKRHVERVFLHCSDSDNESLHGQRLRNAVHAWHTLPKPKGNAWSDIGYHFLIDKLGEVLSGRPLGLIPAAQYPHNTGTIAIMVHGRELDKFPAVALNACRDLCVEINEAYEGRISFHGHCEVSAKTCPVFDYRGLLQLDRFGRMP